MTPQGMIPRGIIPWRDLLHAVWYPSESCFYTAFLGKTWLFYSLYPLHLMRFFNFKKYKKTHFTKKNFFHFYFYTFWVIKCLKLSKNEGKHLELNHKEKIFQKWFQKYEPNKVKSYIKNKKIIITLPVYWTRKLRESLMLLNRCIVLQYPEVRILVISTC